MVNFPEDWVWSDVSCQTHIYWWSFDVFLCLTGSHYVLCSEFGSSLRHQHRSAYWGGLTERGQRSPRSYIKIDVCWCVLKWFFSVSVFSCVKLWRALWQTRGWSYVLCWPVFRTVGRALTPSKQRRLNFTNCWILTATSHIKQTPQISNGPYLIKHIGLILGTS